METILANYPFLEITLLGNTLWQYLLAVLIFISSGIAFKLSKVIILNNVRAITGKTSWRFDDTLADIIDSIKSYFYLYLSFYLALKFLQVTQFIDSVIDAILIIWVTYQAIHAFQIIVKKVANEYLKKEGREGETESAVQAVTILLNIALWSIGGLLILSNSGVDITSLVAGLGIGGVAIAFAVKDILSDLFSSFTIFFDKPFKVGDFVVTNSVTGTVKKIGLKTTRVKSLSGEEVVVPNQQLTSDVIHNYFPMETRRIEFSIGVTYQTPLKKVKAIPEWIETIVSNQDQVDFQRAHFKEFGDSALIYEIVYKLNETDYKFYMDTQQAINLALMEKFAKEKVEFAYPTQMIYTSKS